jgi:5-methylcytosine-specific restriction endonuclease McrA
MTIQQSKNDYYLQHKDNWKIYRQNVLRNHKPELLKYKRQWAKNDRRQRPEHYETMYKKNNAWRAFRTFWNRIEKPIFHCKECKDTKHFGNGLCRKCYVRIWARQAYNKNPQKYIAIQSKYQRNHPEIKQKNNKKYSETHKEQHLAYQKEWSRKNPEGKQERNDRWIKNNKEQYLKIIRNAYDRLRVKYKGLGFKESYPKLNAVWRQIVKNRDNRTCQICGKQGSNAHHMFYQSFYPQLAFNENNGITLCEQCHNETHGKCLVKISWS